MGMERIPVRGQHLASKQHHAMEPHLATERHHTMEHHRSPPDHHRSPPDHHRSPPDHHRSPDHQPPCRFFLRNEPGNSAVYMEHAIRNREGRVLCPQLRSFVCPNCGATGDFAHTRAYCPRGPTVKSVVSALKQTLRLSDGRMRK